MSDEPGGENRAPDDEARRDEVVSGAVVVAGDTRELAHRSWGVLLAIGIVAIVFGIVVLANIWASVHLVAIFAGLFLIFAGVMQVIGAPRSQRRGGRIAAGVIAVIIGIVLVVWPESSVKTVAVLVGLAFVFWGVVWAIAALVDRGEGWVVGFGFGLLLAVVGAVVIAWPGPTIAILMVLVGLNAILFGAASIAQGLALRRA